jgi:hypothetical protein
MKKTIIMRKARWEGRDERKIAMAKAVLRGYVRGYGDESPPEDNSALVRKYTSGLPDY